MSYARFEITDISVALRRRQRALTLKKPIFKNASILIPVRKNIATLTVGLVSTESTDVNVTRKNALQTPRLRALSLKPTVCDLAIIGT